MYFQPSYTKVPGANWLVIMDQAHTIHGTILVDLPYIFVVPWIPIWIPPWSRPYGPENLIFHPSSAPSEAWNSLGQNAGEKKHLGNGTASKKSHPPLPKISGGYLLGSKGPF